MSEFLGREDVVDSLAGQVLAGQTVLVYGPLGVGKTAILDEIARVVGAAGRRIGRAVHTQTIRDVTRALQAVYPEAGLRARNQRQLRGYLSLAVEEDPGVLILDHLQCAGTALKGFLRSLEGTGLGVLIAADVEHQRDNARIRAMRLAHRERQVPPLQALHMDRILEARVLHRRLPYPLTEADRSSLLRIAAGRPGVVGMVVGLLESDRYWRDGRLLSEILRSDVSMAIAEAYVGEVNARARHLEK